MVQLLATLDPPAPGNLRGFKPDYGRIFADHQATVRELLAYGLENGFLKSLFVSGVPYFFVVGDFGHFERNISVILDGLGNAFESPTLPSRADLRSLLKREPISLLNVLRMHLVFEHIRNELPQLRRYTHLDQNTPLFAARSIVPSVRYVDPQRTNQKRTETSIRESDLIGRINEFLEAHPNPGGNGVVDRAPQYLFSDNLEKGHQELPRTRPADPRQVTRNRHKRISTTLAMAIAHALTAEGDLSVLRAQTDALFPEDHNVGPHGGRGTECLGARNGNILYVI